MERQIKDIKILKNEKINLENIPEFLNEENIKNVKRIQEGVEGYSITPLVNLKSLAKDIGVRSVFLKDESKRYNLKAFKGLGGIYAITSIVSKELGLDIDKVNFNDLLRHEYKGVVSNMVFATATDGNHGKGVSWASGKLNSECHVFMPKGSSKMRAQAIKDVNPKCEVEITDMGYDDTVRMVKKLAEENNWYLVQDTSSDGYSEIPTWITQGYTTMVKEALDELELWGEIPTHVFVQAGVGSMAGSVIGYLANRYMDRDIKYIVIEPTNMACVYESIKVGDSYTHPAINQKDTIMAGLNCGEVCEIVWPILRDLTTYAVTCPDSVTKLGMRDLFELGVISGESGAVGAGLLSLIKDEEYAPLREALELDINSNVLLFSTEGNTDPESYKEIVFGKEK